MEVKDYTKEGKILQNDYRTLYITNSQSNCKLTVWDYVSEFCPNGEDIKDIIDNFNEALKISRCLVHVHTSQERIRDIFENNFDVYESIKIPCGYNNGYQYHVFLRNPFNDNRNARKSEFVKNKTTTKQIKDVITKTLKQRRRKLDVVPEIMAQLTLA